MLRLTHCLRGIVSWLMDRKGSIRRLLPYGKAHTAAVDVDGVAARVEDKAADALTGTVHDPDGLGRKA